MYSHLQQIAKPKGLIQFSDKVTKGDLSYNYKAKTVVKYGKDEFMV